MEDEQKRSDAKLATQPDDKRRPKPAKKAEEEHRIAR